MRRVRELSNKRQKVECRCLRGGSANGESEEEHKMSEFCTWKRSQRNRMGNSKRWRVRGKLAVDGVVPEDLGGIVLNKYQKQTEPWESQKLVHRARGDVLLLLPGTARTHLWSPWCHPTNSTTDVLLLLWGCPLQVSADQRAVLTHKKTGLSFCFPQVYFGCLALQGVRAGICPGRIIPPWWSVFLSVIWSITVAYLNGLVLYAGIRCFFFFFPQNLLLICISRMLRTKNSH